MSELKFPFETETNHEYVAADHQAGTFCKAANKVDQCRSLAWGSSQDETLWSETAQRTSEELDISQQ